MGNFLTCIGRAVTDLFGNVHAAIFGIITAVFGYFLPIKDIVHLLILFFMLDVMVGYLAARKLRKERFSVKIIWRHTMPRMLLSIILILMAFMWDDVFAQNLVSTYKIIGWFISGVLIYSIAENGYKLTNWGVFKKLGELVQKKVKDNTDLSIKDGEDGTEAKA